MLIAVSRYIIEGARDALGRAWMTARLRRRYPTCHFYRGATVDDESSLGRYNVIFRNVSIVGSTIGDHTFVQHDSRIHHADVGKFCSIAPGVVIGLGQHPVHFAATHPAFYSTSQPILKTYAEVDHYEPFRRTMVGHDVWIGQNALVSDGVTIGDGAVIAAGSVVTDDVPPYAIVGGVPARILRYRFDESVVREIHKLQWWNMSDNELKEKQPLFLCPERLIDSTRKGK